MGQSKENRLDGLTSLRFFAATMVVLFHTARPLSGWLPGGLLRNGYEAVGFFFVLSGFVLAYSYYAPPSPSVRGGISTFWKGRFSRIYPVYLVAILIATPMYLYGLKTGVVEPHSAVVALIAVPCLLQSWSLSPEISGAINLPA
jgi:peptidoglycan/LPS O-acetylase OafA/YrhL